MLSMEMGGECKRESKKEAEGGKKRGKKIPRLSKGVAGYGSSDSEGHNVSNQKARMRHN